MGLLDRPDDYWMEFAFKEAEKAFAKKEIPVGAVIVKNNQIVGRGHNLREQLNDPTAHAEMLAITSASETIGSWRLDGCTMYVTLEPCPMCAGAILNARLPKVVFGAYDDDAGMCGSVDNLCDQNLLNHKAIVKGGILQSKCESILKEFFSKIRTQPPDSKQYT